MNALRQAAEDYLAVRRALGSKLPGYDRLLAGFAAYLEAAGAATVTTELALAWARLPGEDAHPAYLGKRLCVARGFARHLRAFDPATEIPPARLLPSRSCRAVPYLYSGADIAALMRTARSVRPALRAATYQTLIGLMFTTGLRIGEAIRLDRDDLDWDQGLLTVWHSKFGKSRELPLHPSTLAALSTYASQRERLCPDPRTAGFFVSPAGTRLVLVTVQRTFSRLVRQAGLTARSPQCRPRLHDLRHCLRLPGRARLVPGRTRCRRADAPAVHLPGARRSRRHVLVCLGGPRTAGAGGRTARPHPGEAGMSALAPTLEAFFTERLISQRHASPHTVAAYRDAWRLLLRFIHARTGKEPAQLDLADLGAPVISAFLEHLERERRNSARTRNARLAAIHSFFHYAALRHPEHAGLIAQVLAIPPKRCPRTEVSYLTRPELDALVAAPDQGNWIGRRDHALLEVAAQTGLRVSELTGLRNCDIELGTGAHVRCRGKGRKDRCTPLSRQTVTVLRAWLQERGGDPADPLFPSRRGTALSRGAVTTLVARHTATASQHCPSLRAGTQPPTSSGTAAPWTCCETGSTRR